MEISGCRGSAGIDTYRPVAPVAGEIGIGQMVGGPVPRNLLGIRIRHRRWIDERAVGNAPPKSTMRSGE